MTYISDNLSTILKRLHGFSYQDAKYLIQQVDVAIQSALDMNTTPVPAKGTLAALALHRYTFAPNSASATAVMSATTMLAAAQDILVGITSPDAPRTVSAKGSASGITGNVVVYGKDFAGNSISDTIALNGASEVEGILAFAKVTKIHVPARTHTPVAQVETATAAGTITGAGNATVVVTAAGMSNSPKTFSVAVANTDTASQWAAKVRSVLTADADVSAFFTVSGTTTAIVLTAKTPAANDTSMNISLDNGTCTGITTAATSANTTAGVAPDTVSIGTKNHFGLPTIAPLTSGLHLALFNGSADGGTLAVDASHLEKNLYALQGTPDGTKVLDLVYLVKP